MADYQMQDGELELIVTTVGQEWEQAMFLLNLKHPLNCGLSNCLTHTPCGLDCLKMIQASIPMIREVSRVWGSDSRQVEQLLKIVTDSMEVLYYG